MGKWDGCFLNRDRLVGGICFGFDVLDMFSLLLCYVNGNVMNVMRLTGQGKLMTLYIENEIFHWRIVENENNIIVFEIFIKYNLRLFEINQRSIFFDISFLSFRIEFYLRIF